MRRFVQAIASSSDLPENWPADLREAIASSPDHYNLGKGDETYKWRWGRCTELFVRKCSFNDVIARFTDSRRRLKTEFIKEIA